MYVMLNNFWLCMCLLGMGAHRQPENLITASTVFDVALAIINYACMSDLQLHSLKQPAKLMSQYKVYGSGLANKTKSTQSNFYLSNKMSDLCEPDCGRLKQEGSPLDNWPDMQVFYYHLLCVQLSSRNETSASGQKLVAYSMYVDCLSKLFPV